MFKSKSQYHGFLLRDSKCLWPTLLALWIAFFIPESQASWQKNILDETEFLYGKLAYKHFKKNLIIEISSENSITGSAVFSDSHLKLVLTKGLLNSPQLKKDSLRMLICHELGHFFAGAPRKNLPLEWEGPMANDGLSFSSFEGQSDYYASAVCFKKLAKIGAEEPIDQKRIGPKLKTICQASSDPKICLRSALAGEDFLNLVKKFPISTESFDPTTADALKDSYPSRQCRLDTIIAGARCNDELPMIMDFNNSDLNNCSQIFAQRPKCWHP